MDTPRRRARFEQFRPRYFAAATALIALGAAACSAPSSPGDSGGATGGGDGSPKPGGTLVWGMESEADNLDVHASGGWVTWRVRRQMFEGLINNDLTQDGAEQLKIIPQLAKTWEVSPDGLTYSFALRDGVKFTDGTPFDAASVKFNWDRFYDPQSPYFDPVFRANKLVVHQFLDRIETPDAATVKFVMKQPYSSFPSLMAGSQSPYIGSPASIKQWGKDVGEHPVGTGPFKFVERQRGQKIVLEKNKDYWGTKPHLDGVIYRPLPEAASRVAALRTGEADLILVPPPDTIQQLKDAGFVIKQGPTAHIWYWVPIVRNAPFDNPKVRQAFSLAINREGIAKELMRDTVIPAYSMIPPGAPAYEKEYQPFKYDPAKAKQLLAEAGLASGFSTIIATSVDGSGQLLTVPIAEWIQRDLKAVGIDAKIETYEWQTYLGKGVGNAAWGYRKDLGAYQSSFGAPYNFWLAQIAHSRVVIDARPYGWYKNPQADSLMDRALAELDPTKQNDLYRQANRLFTEDAAYIPVVSDLAPVAMSPKVKGFARTSEESYDLTGIWMEK